MKNQTFSINVYLFIKLSYCIQGEYVTLGYEEHNDIGAMVNHLSQTHDFTNFILWGRSMGAASA